MEEEKCGKKRKVSPWTPAVGRKKENDLSPDPRHLIAKTVARKRLALRQRQKSARADRFIATVANIETVSPKHCSGLTRAIQGLQRVVPDMRLDVPSPPSSENIYSVNDEQTDGDSSQALSSFFDSGRFGKWSKSGTGVIWPLEAAATHDQSVWGEENELCDAKSSLTRTEPFRFQIQTVPYDMTCNVGYRFSSDACQPIDSDPVLTANVNAKKSKKPFQQKEPRIRHVVMY